MNADTTKVIPYGLFRYLYNSFQVRYPDYYMFVEPMLPRDAVAAVGELEAKDLEAHLPTHSWLVGLERPDLFETVQTLSRLSRRVIDVFFEAALILRKPDAAKLMLQHGANPNIFVWRLERSCNVRYSALSYAIDHDLNDMVDALFQNNVDPSGLESAASRSPLALAFENSDFQLIRRLLQAGASLEDGPRYEEAPFFYARNCPVEWVREQLTELLGLLPIEAKPIYHRPNAQAGYHFTLLQCLWGDSEKLDFAEEIGMDLRLTEYEMAQLIHNKQHKTFCALVGRLGESVKKEALARVQREWPEWGT